MKKKRKKSFYNILGVQEMVASFYNSSKWVQLTMVY